MLVTNVFLYHWAFGSSGTSMLSHTPQVPTSLYKGKNKTKKKRKRKRLPYFHAVIDELCFLAVGDNSLLQIALRSWCEISIEFCSFCFYPDKRLFLKVRWHCKLWRGEQHYIAVEAVFKWRISLVLFVQNFCI